MKRSKDHSYAIRAARVSKRLPLALTLTLIPLVLVAQSLDPKALLKPALDSWPTYNGDYSGRRFSPLTEINAANLGSLSLAWFYRVANIGPQRGVGNPSITSTPLMVNGILYFTIPDHAWAIDARTGEEIWSYSWQDKGGHLVGNRGLGMYGDWLYFMTPDCWFISLNAKDGKERWRKKVADEKMQYFCTMSPLVVKNHVMVGVGGDAMDVPGFLDAHDPETGDLQWRWNTTPRKGEPGSETWPSPQAMEHGGGMTWLPGTYDPELNLIYWGTGNPNPVFAGQGRKGANLWTASIVALNADTGKLIWYHQPSPHDTHDWDNVETPVLFDGLFNGRPRKMLAQAARNGIFSVLDRTTGESLVTKGFIGVNWMKGIDAKGQPIPDPAKEPKVDGSLIDTPGGGGTNWAAPSFNPVTGLFYVNAKQGYSVTYLTDDDPQPQGYGGGGGGGLSEPILEALDYKTGNVVWKHNYPSGGFGNAFPGVLSTAAKLLFTGDPSGNLLAFDAATGRILWHFHTGTMVSNGPSTYTLNGSQYLLAGAGDTLFAFKLVKSGN